MRGTRGITLISLVVTIIVLLILAGVSLSLITGGQGILNRASHAVDENKIASAKEQVELKVAEFGADFYQEKYVERINDGTKKEYISNQLKQGQQTQDFYAKAFENDTVKVYEEDELVVTGVILEDGSILWDAEKLDGAENPEIQIVASQTISSDYVKGSLQAQITYTGILSEITINGKLVEAIAGENGVYTIEQEVTENGIYTIMARDEKGDYKAEIVKVTDITEDMEIWNRADMESFRDKVNSGRTFEGRTASVMADIDLEGSEENQWVPVADYATNNECVFKGNFEGNHYSIDYLYINGTRNYQALFGCVDKGTINGVVIGKNSNVTGNLIVGGVVGFLKETAKIEFCVNYAIVNGADGTGGICGVETGKDTLIQYSVNYGTITSGQQVGGIVGIANVNSSINYCYNRGNVTNTSDYGAGGICGTFGHLSGGGEEAQMIGCYNTGKISGKNYGVGGIAGGFYYVGKGQNLLNTGEVYLNSSQTTSLIGDRVGGQLVNDKIEEEEVFLTYSEEKIVDALGHEFTKDVGMNDGYPILKWQIEK